MVVYWLLLTGRRNENNCSLFRPNFSTWVSQTCGAKLSANTSYEECFPLYIRTLDINYLKKFSTELNLIQLKVTNRQTKIIIQL